MLYPANFKPSRNQQSHLKSKLYETSCTARAIVLIAKTQTISSILTQPGCKFTQPNTAITRVIKAPNKWKSKSQLHNTTATKEPLVTVSPAKWLHTNKSNHKPSNTKHKHSYSEPTPHSATACNTSLDVHPTHNLKSKHLRTTTIIRTRHTPTVTNTYPTWQSNTAGIFTNKHNQPKSTKTKSKTLTTPTRRTTRPNQKATVLHTHQQNIKPTTRTRHPQVTFYNRSTITANKSCRQHNCKQTQNPTPKADNLNHIIASRQYRKTLKTKNIKVHQIRMPLHTPQSNSSKGNKTRAIHSHPVQAAKQLSRTLKSHKSVGTPLKYSDIPPKNRKTRCNSPHTRNRATVTMQVYHTNITQKLKPNKLNRMPGYYTTTIQTSIMTSNKPILGCTNKLKNSTHNKQSQETTTQITIKQQAQSQEPKQGSREYGIRPNLKQNQPAQVNPISGIKNRAQATNQSPTTTIAPKTTPYYITHRMPQLSAASRLQHHNQAYIIATHSDAYLSQDLQAYRLSEGNKNSHKPKSSNNQPFNKLI
eukprot:gene3285-2267_t